MSESVFVAPALLAVGFCPTHVQNAFNLYPTCCYTFRFFTLHICFPPLGPVSHCLGHTSAQVWQATKSLWVTWSSKQVLVTLVSSLLLLLVVSCFASILTTSLVKQLAGVCIHISLCAQTPLTQLDGLLT